MESAGAGIVTKAEYARLRGVSRAAVTQWATAGKIVLTGDGRVDVARSDVRLADTTNQARGGKGGRTSAAAAKGLPGSAAPAVASPGAGDRGADPEGGAAPLTLASANTQRAALQAQTLELRLRREAGDLVDRAGFERALVDSLGVAVEQLGTLAARIASRCAAETDARRVHAIIDEEIARVRQDVATRVRALLAAGGSTRQ